MPFQLQIAGKTLEGVVRWREEQPSRVAVERFPRRQGAIVPKVPFKAEKGGRFDFVVDKTSEAALKTYLDDLKNALEAGEGQLFLRDDDRFARAVKTNLIVAHEAGQLPALRASGSIDFVIGDPYWYDGTGEKSAQTLNVPSSPIAFSATNNGGAITPPRVEIKALSVNKTGTFKLTNTTTGIFLSWTGTLNANNLLIVNSVDFSAQANGTNGLKDFVGSFWFLGTGLNNLSYEGPTGVDVKIYWTERWN